MPFASAIKGKRGSYMAKNEQSNSIPIKSTGNSGNREYKSDVFSLLLQDKRYALDVYNALNHSNYEDPEEIEIITTNHGISLSIRNDASFMIDRHINYYEHQASFNPNMPLRCLIYYVNDIQEVVEYNKKDLYGHKTISLPTPHFVVFYNGIEKRPETEVLKLSDSFYHKTDEPNVELICTTYNINPGFNSGLKNESQVLYGYTAFVDKVRQHLQYEELDKAVENAIDECIAEGILADFFTTKRDEVTKMTHLDFTFETREKMIRRDTREETIEELQPQIDALIEENKQKDLLINEKEALIEELRAQLAAVR